VASERSGEGPGVLTLHAVRVAAIFMNRHSEEPPREMREIDLGSPARGSGRRRPRRGPVVGRGSGAGRRAAPEPAYGLGSMARPR
jgi:hypothetical protein